MANNIDSKSTVPDTTESLKTKLTKVVKEQWKLTEAMKEQGVGIEQLKPDLNKEPFKVARQRGLTTMVQQNARRAILRGIEFHKKLSEIHEASKPPERISDDEIFIASMTWRNV